MLPSLHSGVGQRHILIGPSFMIVVEASVPCDQRLAYLLSHDSISE